MSEWPADLELRRPLATPAEVDVVLECPECHVVESIGAKLSTRLVVDQGGTSKLSLRVRALKLEHVCGQATLEILARDQGDT